jgi:hypothetical protein
METSNIADKIVVISSPRWTRCSVPCMALVVSLNTKIQGAVCNLFSAGWRPSNGRKTWHQNICECEKLEFNRRASWQLQKSQ